jgi:hypothetical protein
MVFSATEPSRESEALRQLTRRVDEVLHYIWDPIGVSGVVEARDEYDMYVPQVVGLLTRKATPQEIAAFLARVAAERMGLNPDPEAAERAALAACGWSARLLPP